MKHRNIILAVLLVGVSIGPQVAYTKAIPHGSYPPHESLEKPDNSEPQSEYKPLLAKYKANIEKLRHEAKESRTRFYQKEVERMHQAALEISGKESQVLDKLRAERQRRHGRKLDFNGEVYESTVVIPSSDVSARVFAKLLEEDGVDTCQLLVTLNMRPCILSQEWISLLKKVVGKAQPYSPTWQLGIKTLYKSGESRSKYRPLLKRIVTEDGDFVALHMLLFDTDKKTGSPIPVQTRENRVLVKALLNRNSPPDIRFTCAEYAAATGDPGLAEDICIELLSRRYKGLDNPDAPSPPEDSLLCRARVAALRLMFYELRTERAFKFIYDRSRIAWTETEHPETIKGYKFIFSGYGELEVGCAEALIGGVKDYEESKG